MFLMMNKLMHSLSRKVLLRSRQLSIFFLLKTVRHVSSMLKRSHLVKALENEHQLLVKNALPQNKRYVRTWTPGSRSSRKALTKN